MKYKVQYLSFIMLLIGSLLIGIVSCKKEKTPDPVTPSAPTFKDSKEYIKYKFAGVDYSFSEPDNGVWDFNSGGLMYKSDPLSNYHQYYQVWNNYQIHSSFNLWFQDTCSATSVNQQIFTNFFTVKSYPFLSGNVLSSNTTTIMDNGFQVDMSDNSNVHWQSFRTGGPTIQTGTFNITELTSYSNQQGGYIVKFKATFNCKLYNSAGTDSTMLTNGELIASFQKY